MAYDKMHLSVGSVRCANERRQYGALLMVTGIVAVLAPLARIVSAINTDGLTGEYADPATITFWTLVGGFCMLLIGVTAVTTGFAECIHDAGATGVTFYAILITQVRVNSHTFSYLLTLEWGVSHKLDPVVLSLLKSQLAFIPYITDMVHIGQLSAKDGPIFWHEISEIGQETSREMTSTDVRFIGAMG